MEESKISVSVSQGYPQSLWSASRFRISTLWRTDGRNEGKQKCSERSLDLAFSWISFSSELLIKCYQGLSYNALGDMKLEVLAQRTKACFEK